MSIGRWFRRLRGVPEPEDVQDGPSELLPADPSVLPAPTAAWGATVDAHAPELLPAPGESGEALEVYADALMSAGDLRGELVALMLRGEHAHATALRQQHRAHFYGPAADWRVLAMNQLADIALPRQRPRVAPDPGPPVAMRVHWHAGFIDGLRVQVTPDRVEPLVELLHHPSCARLRILILGGTRMHGLGERLAQRGPLPAIERLHIGDFTMGEFEHQEADQGVWPDLDRVFPNLRHLAASAVAELGPFPALQTLQITREEAFARVTWPEHGRLAGLEMARLCGARAEDLLERRDLHRLRDLRVGREVARSFVQALAKRPELLASLETLGFQRCDMRNTARPLIALLPELTALRMLYVPSADTAYHAALARELPGRLGVAPPEMRYAHFWREVTEPALGVLSL